MSYINNKIIPFLIPINIFYWARPNTINLACNRPNLCFDSSNLGSNFITLYTNDINLYNISLSNSIFLNNRPWIHNWAIKIRFYCSNLRNHKQNSCITTNTGLTDLGFVMMSAWQGLDLNINDLNRKCYSCNKGELSYFFHSSTNKKFPDIRDFLRATDWARTFISGLNFWKPCVFF